MRKHTAMQFAMYKHIKTPEEKLWCNVLIQAVQDAYSGLTGGYTMKIVKDAQKYMESGYWRNICSAIGIEPDYFSFLVEKAYGVKI